MATPADAAVVVRWVDEIGVDYEWSHPLP